MIKSEIKIRMNLDLLNELNKKVSITGLSREAYVRSLISGYIPRAIPSEDFNKVIKQLRSIGNNLNQITVIANSTGKINNKVYKDEVTKLRNAILEIREIVYGYDKIK